jgi:hypothetical protein
MYHAAAPATTPTVRTHANSVVSGSPIVIALNTVTARTPAATSVNVVSISSVAANDSSTGMDARSGSMTVAPVATSNAPISSARLGGIPITRYVTAAVLRNVTTTLTVTRNSSAWGAASNASQVRPVPE